MNHRSLLYVTTALIFVFSCQKKTGVEATINNTFSSIKGSTTSATTTLSTDGVEVQPFFHKGVGRAIGKDTAKRWINNFIQKNGTKKDYTITSTSLQQILSQPNCIGLCLYYGVDDAGKVHILPIGINEAQSVIKMNTVPTESGSINWETAMLWRARYIGTVKAHFFGANTFDRLINKQGSPAIRTTLATNDTNAPQLLLSNSTEGDPRDYEDESAACPTACPTGFQ